MPMSHSSTGTYRQINGHEKKTGGAYLLTNFTSSSVATVWNGLTWACYGQKYTMKFRLGQNYNYCLVLMLCGLSIKLQKRLGPDVHILRFYLLLCFLRRIKWLFGILIPSNITDFKKKKFFPFSFVINSKYLCEVCSLF